MRVVYGVAPSPFVRKVRVVLAEKGLVYGQETVVHHLLPGDFPRVNMAISPLGKIPAFRDGDVTLADSSVICAYLERTNPQLALYPAEPYPYARALSSRWAAAPRRCSRAPHVVRGVCRHGPLLGADCEVLFLMSFLVPRFTSQPPDAAVIERIVEDELPPLFDYLEGELVETAALVGDGFSIADVAIATQFVNLCCYAGVAVDSGRWPKLARYVQGIHARPSFRKLIEEERAMYAPTQ